MPALLAVGCRHNAASPRAILRKGLAGTENLEIRGTKEYRGQELYNYMNGAAETYYMHGFLVLGIAELERGETRALVELYQLEAPANATALFASYRDKAAKPLDAGTEGIYWPAQEIEGLFHRGPFFCRVYVYAPASPPGRGAPALKLLNDIASGVDAATPK